jgi:hypothetical protein
MIARRWTRVDEEERSIIEVFHLEWGYHIRNRENWDRFIALLECPSSTLDDIKLETASCPISIHQLERCPSFYERLQNIGTELRIPGFPMKSLLLPSLELMTGDTKCLDVRL